MSILSPYFLRLQDRSQTKGDWGMLMEFLRRYWPLLSLLSLVIGLALLAPHQARYDPTNPYAYEEATNQIANWDWTLAAAIVAAFFTAILAVVSTVQVFDTRESSERQLRAYISFKPGDAILKEGHSPSVEAILINAGQTPAYDLRTVSWGDVFEVKSVNKFSCKEPDESIRPSMVIAPNGGDLKIFAEGEKPITAEVMTSIRHGTHAFFGVGLAVYWDTFRREERRSTFVFKIGKEELRVGRASLWHNGNDAT